MRKYIKLCDFMSRDIPGGNADCHGNRSKVAGRLFTYDCLM